MRARTLLLALAALGPGLAAPAAAEVTAGPLTLDPYAVVVGGVHVQTLQTRPDDDREGRTTTLALSRLGLRGQLGDKVWIESEFEVNAGPHGTSVWEGQAAMQVRNQLVRFAHEGFRIDAGRVTDEATLDFHSAHVADQLLTDPYVRSHLLASGFNRGNGVLARWQAGPGLSAGLAFNAANPTSTTASLMIGGTFPPFSRFYHAPHQHVGRDASGFPSDLYHIMMLTPSVLWAAGPLEGHAAVQLFRVDIDTSSRDDENLIGYNLRAGLRLPLARRRLVPFVNASRVTNSMVNPDDGRRLSPDAFVGLTLSGGLDFHYTERFGVGVQHAVVREQQGSTSRLTEHFFNLGATWWLTGTTSVGARGSAYVRCAETAGAGPCEPEGARSLFVTMRTLL